MNLHLHCDLGFLSTQELGSVMTSETSSSVHPAEFSLISLTQISSTLSSTRGPGATGAKRAGAGGDSSEVPEPTLNQMQNQERAARHTEQRDASAFSGTWTFLFAAFSFDSDREPKYAACWELGVLKPPPTVVWDPANQLKLGWNPPPNPLHPYGCDQCGANAFWTSFKDTVK